MSKGLTVCGLGVRPPDDTTLETLEALEACDVVFCDVKDAAVFKWLGGYCKTLRRPKDASDIARAARSGSAGLAVWGHPQFSSALARRAQLACRRSGTPCRVLGAVSPVGSAFARSVSFLGGDYGYQGIQGYELLTLLEEDSLLALDLPLVVYAEAAPAAAWKRLGSLLAARYPKGHELRVFAAGSSVEQRARVGQGALPLEGGVVLVPPVGGPVSACPPAR